MKDEVLADNPTNMDDGGAPSDTQYAGDARATIWRRLLHQLGPYIGVIVVLVAVTAYLSVTQPAFPTYANAINILQTSAVGLIVGVGLTLVLLCGGFDISVGGMVSLAGVGMALLITNAHVPPLIAILIVVIGGGVIGGGLNGFLIAKVGLQFFVVTIGTMGIFAGLALVITGGASEGLYNNQFIVNLGQGTVGGIPYVVIIAAVVALIGFVVTRYIGYGRMIYAVGGNEEAARLSGINVVGVRASTYVICAALAALGGVVQAALLASAEPTAGSGIPLTAAAAVLLGGTSFEGGIGGVVGTVLGTLFLGVIANGLTIAGVSSFYQGIISGVVLILAILVDRVRRSRL